MRQGQQDVGLLFDKRSKTLLGVGLGWDHVSEHEWGIKPLKKAFGCVDDGFGVERDIVHTVPKNLKYHYKYDKSKVVYAGFFYRPYTEPNDVEYLKQEVRFFADQTIWSGWDDRSFGVFATDEGTRTHLNTIFKALNTPGETAIWVAGKSNPFANGGCFIGIVDRLPKENLETWAQADRDYEQLKLDAKATGIENRLRKAGKKWFSLSPRRQEDGSIIFWLNSSTIGERDEKQKYGWFTVEDLDLWILNKGPVMRRAT